MLILISPAKTLDYQSPLATTRYTLPELLSYSQQLIGVARHRRKAAALRDSIDSTSCAV